MGAPQLDRLVNNTLVKFIPESLDMLAQLINIAAQVPTRLYNQDSAVYDISLTSMNFKLN